MNKAYEIKDKFRIQDVDIEERHKKYAKSNYYKFDRGIEHLGWGVKSYGSYRFHPSGVEILSFDMLTIANFLRGKDNE